MRTQCVYQYSARSYGELAPADLLIVQATPFCNIDCSYCYLGNRSDRSRMSTETVQAIARFIRYVPLMMRPLPVVWHAGEPLTAPVAFYERAFQCFAADRAPVQHYFQTNGTLIDDAWCALMKRWSVRVGVSIDGPRYIHDAHRLDRGGRGTFDRVMHGIAKLREHEIAFSVLAVVTSKSLDYADEIWSFFESLGTKRIAFNIEESDGIHKGSSLEKGHLEAFKGFLRRIADLQGDERGITVRELDKMRGHLSAPPEAKVRRSDNRAGSILNVDIRGNLTTFSPELLGIEHPKYGKFSWGNVHTHSWSELALNPEFQRARADIAAGVESCRRSCGYFSVCGGGCPSNKLTELDTFCATETQYCRFHVQAVADVMIDRIEKEKGIAPNDNREHANE